MIRRYFHTIRYLKPVQLRYRIFYAIRNRLRKLTGFRYPVEREPNEIMPLNLAPSIKRSPIWNSATNRFEFLGLEHTFGAQVDWHFNKFGKLWTYNLHYFEYLCCESIQPEEALELMRHFVANLPETPEANEPYPVSLRLFFWIRFFAEQNIGDSPTLLNKVLYAQAYTLLDQLELHLMGNHYLENGFALLFAAYRFRDPVLFERADKILISELNEQILPDGAHFELSPMYHQILLYRTLDAFNLLNSNPEVFPKNKLKALLSNKAAKMLGWLRQMTFDNGDIPLFNDAVFGIAPTSVDLFDYANRLKIEQK